jgi:hypothetical protein
MERTQSKQDLHTHMRIHKNDPDYIVLLVIPITLKTMGTAAPRAAAPSAAATGSSCCRTKRCLRPKHHLPVRCCPESLSTILPHAPRNVMAIAASPPTTTMRPLSSHLRHSHISPPPPSTSLVVDYDVFYSNRQVVRHLRCCPPSDCNPSTGRAKGTCDCCRQHTCPDAHVRTPVEG